MPRAICCIFSLQSCHNIAVAIDLPPHKIRVCASNNAQSYHIWSGGWYFSYAVNNLSSCMWNSNIYWCLPVWQAGNVVGLSDCDRHNQHQYYCEQNYLFHKHISPFLENFIGLLKLGNWDLTKIKIAIPTAAVAKIIKSKLTCPPCPLGRRVGKFSP